MSARYRKSWTEAELSKLKGLAGTLSTAEIAMKLGRGISATIAKAHQLKVSLRKRRELRFNGISANPEPSPSGMDLS